MRYASTLLAAILLTTLSAQARSLDQIQADGKLVMLCFPHQESEFVRVDLSRGSMPTAGDADDFVGIDVDLVSALAKELGVALEIRPVSEPSYAALIPELLAGRGDLVASSFSITEARRKTVDFSRPYFSVYPVVLVRRDSMIDGPEDLAGLRGTVTSGSSLEEHLLSMEIPDLVRVPSDFSIETFARVTDGEADFTLSDSASARAYLSTDDALRIAFRLPADDRYGIAVPPGSDLLPALDDFLERIERSGRLDEIIARHLGARDR
ncbi:MAG: ABC transporter substrate-binding protein [Acidobacteriota bacterium]